MARFKPITATGKMASGASGVMGIQPVDEEDGGDMTSREAGNMVKRMVQYAEEQLKNKGQI